MSDFTLEDHTTTPTTNALETTTIALENSTDEGAELETGLDNSIDEAVETGNTATTSESTTNMGETESTDTEMSHQMIVGPDKKVGSDNKIGSRPAEGPPPVRSLYLLQIGTGSGVIVGLLVLVLGIVARKRRSTRRREVVVMRDGVDENPLYGQLRESDIVEMRDVNTYYAGPLDDDTDEDSD